MTDVLISDTYDIVTAVGCLYDNHITEECFSCFRDLIRVLKPGKRYYTV